MLNLPRNVGTLTGPAELAPIDGRALAAHRHQWVPHLLREPDAQWDWDTHRRAIGTLHGWLPGEYVAHCALWSGGQLEGLLVLSGPHTCVDPTHAGAEAVYVEFLASAPWHRRHLQLPPQSMVSGVGALLMNEAIELGRRAGLNGRVAWDSKASAVGPYRRMFHRACSRPPLECGTDASTGEVAMEVDAKLAAAWHYP